MIFFLTFTLIINNKTKDDSKTKEKKRVRLKKKEKNTLPVIKCGEIYRVSGKLLVLLMLLPFDLMVIVIYLLLKIMKSSCILKA